MIALPPSTLLVKYAVPFKFFHSSNLASVVVQSYHLIRITVGSVRIEHQTKGD